jgi:prepilin-type N-terminal cleavage/methylation domain-containing protein
MSLISAHSSRVGGFTLAELMIALALMLVLIIGVVSAWLFLGQNFSRLVNTQEQSVKSRRVLQQFTQDLSAASTLTTATGTQLVLTMPAASGTSTITYTYTAGANDTGTLTRNDGTTTTTLLTYLRSFDFNYYNEGGTSITPNIQSVKSVDFSYTSAVGTTAIGTKSVSAMVSPRVVMRNKAILQ